jgi:hypothetical protein
MQRYYCDNDAVHSDPVGLDFGQFGTYYKSHEVEGELARLRERVEELELNLSAETIAANRHFAALQESRERVAELAKRDSLLLITIRWLAANGVYFDDNMETWRDRVDYIISIPDHLAPLIAEAVKQESKDA